MLALTLGNQISQAIPQSHMERMLHERQYTINSSRPFHSSTLNERYTNERQPRVHIRFFFKQGIYSCTAEPTRIRNPYHQQIVPLADTTS